jgi:predicted RecB family nuclease
MKRAISASLLYNYIQCPHRVYLDLFEDPSKRDSESRFMQLLWEMGTLFERKTVSSLAVPFTDLSGRTGADRELLTREAIERGDGLIYGGRIRADNLVGDPDLLRKDVTGYAAGDIKSGSGFEGSEGRLKKHYAVQLGLYKDILKRKGIDGEGTPFIWDVHGSEVPYDFERSLGPGGGDPLWQVYLACLEAVEGIVYRDVKTTPAWASLCKQCHWHSLCLSRLKELDDLTLIPYLGRSKRDAMIGSVETVSALASCDLTHFMDGKSTVFPRLRADRLGDFQLRARLQKQPDARPVLKNTLTLPEAEVELFFDIETDPMRDICYLHGFVERYGGDSATERYVSFFAPEATDRGERDAFSCALQYVHSKEPCIIYYYSKYERTWLLKLQERYAEVASREEIESLFDRRRAVDLYSDAVFPCTDWPTIDYSIKSIARYLGFSWRDQNPSGAESIEWYHSWTESKGESIKQRILDYNEDDCRAMRVLLDALKEMKEDPTTSGIQRSC